MAVCGSCGMNVDGEPKLTCKTSLAEYGDTVEVAPLANFPVIRDLVIEMDGFMEKFKAVKPWVIVAKEKAAEEGTYRQSPEQLAAFKQFSMCINCMLCYAACPVVSKEPDFLGPAAIALGHRYNLDSRDEGAAERNEIFRGEGTVFMCSYANECSEVCPKNVDPAAAVNQAKLNSVIDWATSFVERKVDASADPQAMTPPSPAARARHRRSCPTTSGRGRACSRICSSTRPASCICSSGSSCCASRGRSAAAKPRGTR
jgi:fumarate reductase iron-sulfur subunit